MGELGELLSIESLGVSHNLREQWSKLSIFSVGFVLYVSETFMSYTSVMPVTRKEM